MLSTSTDTQVLKLPAAPCPECKWCVSRCGLACRLGHAQTRNYKGTGQAVRHTNYSGPSCPGPLLPSYCSSRLEELWLHVGYNLNNNINKPTLYTYIYTSVQLFIDQFPFKPVLSMLNKALSINSLYLLGHPLVLADKICIQLEHMFYILIFLYRGMLQMFCFN